MTLGLPSSGKLCGFDCLFDSSDASASFFADQVGIGARNYPVKSGGTFAPPSYNVGVKTSLVLELVFRIWVMGGVMLLCFANLREYRAFLNRWLARGEE